MHIDSDKLVGTYVSDRYSEKGTVTIVLTDGDSTPTREYTRYKYVQTEQLTAIGVAVKDYGAILVPETTIALFESGVLNAGDFGVFVKFNDEYYSVSLSDILSVDVITPIEFEENSFDDYPTVTFNATLPPYSVNNVGQVPTVDENGGIKWGEFHGLMPVMVSENDGVFSADHTYAEILAAINSGTLPVVITNSGIFYLHVVGPDFIAFSNTTVESQGTFGLYGTIYATDEIYVGMEEAQAIPPYFDANTGDVLTVIDNVPQWSPPAQEIPTYNSLDEDKVLTVGSGGSALVWQPNPTPHLYEHHIDFFRNVTGGSLDIYFTLMTTSADSFPDIQSVIAYLYSIYEIGKRTRVACSGRSMETGNERTFVGISSPDGETISVVYVDSAGQAGMWNPLTSSLSFDEEVVQIF